MTLAKMKKKTSKRRSGSAGFTMIEMLVAVGLFVIIGGAAISLFKQHAPLFTQQQALTGLNVTMRNAMAQMQMDVVNAGSGYYPGTNFPDWPIGITINNNVAGSSCYNSTTKTYTANCFDTLNVIAMDPATPPSHPSGNALGTTQPLSTSSPIYAIPTVPTTANATALAANFKSGDEILLVNVDGTQLTTVILTSNGTVSGTAVQLNFTPTNGQGVNTSDPVYIAADNASGKLSSTFNTTDWLMKLAPVTYTVDATDPTNPKLTRKQGSAAADVIAEQIIGFKVGATVVNPLTNAASDDYGFDTSLYSKRFATIRAVQLSLIGRTAPNAVGGSNFTNNFDGGNYQIQSISLTVNPRNLSMRD
jgi:prepilin-type N-terminal cleavage/methylation domain-containing protein